MDLNTVRNTILFRGMNDEEIQLALKELKAKETSYKKGESIFLSGSTTEKMGLILAGSVTIESNDIWGNRTILSHVGKGQFFAETYALLENEPLMVDVVANESCTVLFLYIKKFRRKLNPSSPWQIKLLANMLTITTQKNLLLSNRSFHTAPKTIRGRVMSYLNSVSLRTQLKEFDIPFDRQQLSDYLNLERSALSKELGKMQRDGLIEVKKNHFVIKSQMETF